MAGLTLSTSCNDFLTEDVRGSENLETYFSTPEEVETYVGGCYFQIAKGGGWWQIYNTWLMSDMTTDDLWDGNTTQDDGYQDVTHFMPTGYTSGILQNFWVPVIRVSPPAISALRGYLMSIWMRI